MFSNDSLSRLLGSKVHASLIEGWRKRGIERLLPVQLRAIEAANRASALLDGNNLMAVAPTSSGKTMIAEIAMAVQLSAGRKAIYLVPTKALAEEKFAAFSRWTERAGFRVACATRDRPETDPLIAAGKFDILVAVYEKMNHLLLTQPQILAGVGILAVDEIQTLGDPDRGGWLDLLLTKIRLSPYAVQIVALSAALSEASASAMSRWLDCDLIVDHRRPRELREGVLDLSTGVFRFREVNSAIEGEEVFAPPETLERRMTQISERLAEIQGPADLQSVVLIAAAELFAERGEQVLIFAPTRAASRHWAKALADADLGFPPARLALPKLRETELGRSAGWVRHCLEKGVAYHNADLPEEIRTLTEEAFNSGEARIVVSTATLGVGVNLAGRNVLQCPWRVTGCSNNGGFAQSPLGRSRFANQGGRAARLGEGEEFGRSLVVAENPAQAERFWTELILAPPDSIPPPLARADSASVVLDLLAGGLGRTEQNLQEAMAKTFSANVVSKSESFAVESSFVAQALETCSRLNLVRRDESGEFRRLTGLGEATAGSGITPKTSARLAAEIPRLLADDKQDTGEGKRNAECRAFQIFLMLALTDEGQRAMTGLGFRKSNAPSSVCIREIRVPLPARSGGISRRELSALRMASALMDWIVGREIGEMEDDYGISAGCFARAAGDFQWLVSASASIAETLAAPRNRVAELRVLAGRTGWGVPESGLELARLRSPGLGRGAIMKLLAEGLDSALAVAQAERETLVRLVGQDAAMRLEERASQFLTSRERRSNQRATLSKADDPSPTSSHSPAPSPTHFPSSSPSPSATPAPSVLLEINLQSPGIVFSQGREVALPPLSFELLAALAERPGEVATRQSLYARLWPDGGPEEQQLDGHRRVLLRRLRPVLGKSAERVAQVIRGIGFRFSVPAESIRLRR